MKTIADIILNFKNNDKTAIIYKTDFRTFKLPYSLLHEKILKTAALFDSYNLKKGDRILIWGYNSPEWAIVFFAASLRGIILVPIDYIALQDYVKKISSIVEAKLIIHSEYKILPKTNIKSFILEYLDKYLEGISAPQIKIDVTEDDILEIVFTSGTTGDPKGVVLTHKNVMSNLRSLRKFISISQDQAFLSLLPLSHLFEQTPGFLCPLSAGCSIVYIKSLRPALISKALAQEKITNIVLVPRLLKLFADGILRNIENKKITGLFNKLLALDIPTPLKKALFCSVHRRFGLRFQYFIVGGAPLTYELELFWKRLGFTVLQGYGLTECSPVLTANPLTRQKTGSVGIPVPGIQIKFNEDGEICAKGDSITSGYYHEKKKTKELFKNGWMKTGDIGFRDSEGYIFLKGRKKDVIIASNGINVYPDDIEKILLEDKNVQDVCVLGLPAENGEEVHAEVLLKKKANLKELIDSANTRLNQSQQIQSFSLWPEKDFPRTTTMKIRKHVVLEKILNRNTSKSEAEAISAPKLYTAISKIVGISTSQIMPDSALALDLKLSSIGRVELISALEQEFNVDIDEEEITAKTTVGQLEKIIAKRASLIKKKAFRRWLLWPVNMAFRLVYSLLIQDNIIRLFCRRKVIGKENLANFRGPAIFIANHVGYFDTPNVYMSLPLRIRTKIAAAAWQEYFEIPKRQIFKKLLFSIYYEYASLFANTYNFPKKSGFKQSLEYTGELIDKGWNILFFPEGEHSKSGKLQAFRSGIGWLVKEMRVPIVPIKHFGMEKIMAGDHHQIPRFGKVAVKIGKPLKLDYTKSIPEITSELHDILAKM